MDLEGRLSNPRQSFIRAVALLPVLMARPYVPPIHRPVWQVQHRLDASEVAALIDGRTAGATIEALTREFGIHHTTVIAHLRRAAAEQQTRPGIP